MRGASATLLTFLTLSCSLVFFSSTAADGAVEPGTPVAVPPGVPDQGRSWELVTPADVVSAVPWSVFGISPDGNRIIYSTIGLLPDAPMAEPTYSPAIASRTASGWSSRTIPVPAPAFATVFEPGPVAISPDFESSIWASEIEGGDFALFRSPLYGEYTPLVVGRRTYPAAGLIGSSLDIQRLAVESEEHLLPADASRTSGASIYEVDGQALHLVDVDDEGALLSDCGSSGGGPSSVSDDGSRIFFETSPGCSGPQRVFMRANGATTTEISASQCDLPDCGPEADVSFAGATPSGSAAFLVTKQRLTDEDGDSDADLYRYDVDSGKLTLISTDIDGRDLTLAEGGEEVHPAADGSRVYFRALEETAPGETSPPRLYMADASGPHLVCTGTPSRFMQVTPNGRYAVFATAVPLVAGDTDASLDVYRYDAENGSLIRISTGSQGGDGPFDAKIEFQAATVADHPYRVMSDDGSRIFFTTSERLLPEDDNEVTDVYEWAEGNLGLISSGAGDRGSSYLGSTPDGSTVLFETADTLIPGDRDGGDPDFYVARVGGGFPEASPPTGCSDSCPGKATGRLERPALASTRGPAKGIRLRPIAAAARRRILTSGWIELLAEVPAAGRLSAQARTRIGAREQTVASTSVKASQAGPLLLRMRLSRPARRSLAAGHDLRLQLRLRLAGLDSVCRLSLELSPGS